MSLICDILGTLEKELERGQSELDSLRQALDTAVTNANETNQALEEIRDAVASLKMEANCK